MSCWLWRGRRNRSGYGEMRHGTKRHALAHRVVYEVVVGPIPDGLTIDHMCHVRLCVNPSHLRTLTKEENSRGA